MVLDFFRDEHLIYFKLQSNYAVHSTWFVFFWESSKDEFDYLWLLVKDCEWTKRSVLEVMCFWAILQLVAFSVCGFFELLLPVWRWWHTFREFLAFRFLILCGFILRRKLTVVTFVCTAKCFTKKKNVNPKTCFTINFDKQLNVIRLQMCGLF